MLRRERHPNFDFFVADLSPVTFKDDRASMEHPLFSLSKTPDRVVRRYEHNDVQVTVAPGPHGLPTIWDKDILIYCCSQLIEGMRRDREPKREIVIPTFNFLVTTNRSTGRRGYDLMTQALERLSGVRITTNIETGGEINRQGFGLIGDWETSYKLKENRITHLRVELSQWLYRAVTGYEVLTIDKDYFRLDGGVERRIYELCRKHCGHQSRWSISLDLLYKKSGSRAPLRNFRIAIKKLAASNHLPDYRLTFAHDLLTVSLRTRKARQPVLKDEFEDL